MNRPAPGAVAATDASQISASNINPIEWTGGYDKVGHRNCVYNTVRQNAIPSQTLRHANDLAVTLEATGIVYR